ncbi:hypothetical protein MHYP_G00041020 [Metynnis hypsauchen]
MSHNGIQRGSQGKRIHLRKAERHVRPEDRWRRQVKPPPSTHPKGLQEQIEVVCCIWFTEDSSVSQRTLSRTVGHCEGMLTQIPMQAPEGPRMRLSPFHHNSNITSKPPRAWQSFTSSASYELSAANPSETSENIGHRHF